MRSVKTWLLRRLVQYHWNRVKEAKGMIFTLYDQGEPLTSEKYQKPNRQVDIHGMILVALDRELEELILDGT